MIRYFMLGILIFGVNLAVGCGTASASGFEDVQDTEVMSLKRAGNSNGNLFLDIEIEAESERDNASDASHFKTEFEVKVRKNNTHVNNATITVQAYDGPTLTLKRDDNGEYEGSINHYHRAYRIDVIAGDDRVEEIYIAGPAIHVFTNPTQNQTIPRDQDLAVTWQVDDDGVDEVRIDGDELDDRNIEDSGTYTVPAAALDDDDDDELELKRIIRLPLATAANGSKLKIEVKNEVEFKLQ